MENKKYLILLGRLQRLMDRCTLWKNYIFMRLWMQKKTNNSDSNKLTSVGLVKSILMQTFVFIFIFILFCIGV